MLGIMRKYKESPVIKIVFIVIVLSFIGTIFLVWGRGGDRGRGEGSFAAKVDGTKISLGDFDQAYNRTRGVYEQIYGRSLTPEMEKSMGLKKMTLDTLIDNVLILKQAKRMGINVGKDEVAAEIAKVPAFQKDGVFNFDQYQLVLRSNRMTPAAFEDAEQDELTIQKARTKVKDGAKVTDQEILDAFKKQNDKVDLQFVSYSPADVKGGIKLTDAELNVYLQDHQADFKTPEQVSLAYAVVSPSQFASKMAVTPEEAQAYYQKNIDRYQDKGGILPFDKVKEQATADALKQKAAKETYEKAADAVNKFKSQGDINAAAAALGAKVEKTALFTAAAPAPALVSEKEVVSRAFALKQGELGGPVETAKGIYLLKVVDRKPAAVPPLAEIRAKVEAKALEAKAAEVAKKKAEEALGQLAKGGVATKDTGAFGYNAQGTIPSIGASPELMDQAFALTSAAPVAKKVVKVGDRWYAVKLKHRIEAPTTELAKSKEAIRQSLLPKKQQDAMAAWLKDLKSKAKIEVNPAIMGE
ncbi:SurA N-terminal domain-containing protein [Geomonas sp.]|uniref:SurA N-terminal domain-containing protein n=1 Tax=Geomonas sp. TaxID=2651584 RepID=UPI002B461FBB|nr:SurA N-terminal domain-containing protein [Geomonas sp.]HJV34347.1 SurA N-terminal domain-containing protein [Geomonas sp.]